MSVDFKQIKQNNIKAFKLLCEYIDQNSPEYCFNNFDEYKVCFCDLCDFFKENGIIIEILYCGNDLFNYKLFYEFTFSRHYDLDSLDITRDKSIVDSFNLLEALITKKE